jgi:hypothetical protein
MSECECVGCEVSLVEVNGEVISGNPLPGNPMFNQYFSPLESQPTYKAQVPGVGVVVLAPMAVYGIGIPGSCKESGENPEVVECVEQSGCSMFTTLFMRIMVPKGKPAPTITVTPAGRDELGNASPITFLETQGQSDFYRLDLATDLVSNCGESVIMTLDANTAVMINGVAAVMQAGTPSLEIAVTCDICQVGSGEEG